MLILLRNWPASEREGERGNVIVDLIHEANYLQGQDAFSLNVSCDSYAESHFQIAFFFIT